MRIAANISRTLPSDSETALCETARSLLELELEPLRTWQITSQYSENDQSQL